MNTRLDEFLLEERRRDIQHDIQEILLEKQALKSKVFHPNVFTRSMGNFGRWLVIRGEMLVKRYETPAKKCRSAGQSSYAH